MISAQQIRAARAMLAWSLDTLAEKAGVSANTINKFENGENITFDRLVKIRRSLENENIEFSGRTGVNRREETSKSYDGVEGRDRFFDDLLSVAKEGGEIVAIFRTAEIFARSLGVEDFSQLSRLKLLAKHATVKCLLSDAPHSSLDIPFFRFKAGPQAQNDLLSFITYGDRQAVIITPPSNCFYYFVMQSIEVAQTCREDFATRWSSGVSFDPKNNKE